MKLIYMDANNFLGIDRNLDAAISDTEIKKIRQQISACVRVAQGFSKHIGLVHPDVISMLGLGGESKRNASSITDQEIIWNIEDINRRLQAIIYVVRGVHALSSKDATIEELRETMYGIDKISTYTGDELDNFDLWYEMVNGNPERAASYQAQNFG